MTPLCASVSLWLAPRQRPDNKSRVPFTPHTNMVLLVLLTWRGARNAVPATALRPNVRITKAIMRGVSKNDRLDRLGLAGSKTRSRPGAQSARRSRSRFCPAAGRPRFGGLTFSCGVALSPLAGAQRHRPLRQPAGGWWVRHDGVQLVRREFLRRRAAQLRLAGADAVPRGWTAAWRRVGCSR